MVHIGILSSDDRLLSGPATSDRVSAIPPDGAVSAAEALDADVYVVDARKEERVQLVRELVATRLFPIIVVGRSDDPAEVTRYLDAGADDFLGLDMSAQELGARIRATARRRPPRQSRPAEQEYVLGDVTISLDRHEVRKNGEPIRLTPTEFRLLEELVQHANNVVSHRKLMAAVWGLEHLSSKHYLRVYIRQLRKKLEEDPDLPQLIRTVWGHGYELRCEGRTSA